MKAKYRGTDKGSLAGGWEGRRIRGENMGISGNSKGGKGEILPASPCRLSIIQPS